MLHPVNRAAATSKLASWPLSSSVLIFTCFAASIARKRWMQQTVGSLIWLISLMWFFDFQVRAAIAALQVVGDLRKPSNMSWTSNLDMLDWLCFTFGFQVTVISYLTLVSRDGKVSVMKIFRSWKCLSGGRSKCLERRPKLWWCMV